MKQLTLGKISLEDLQAIVSLRARGIRDYDWTSVAELSLDPELTTKAQGIQAQLLATQVHLLNEATIWARGIYPLLSLAEQGPSIQAWAEVSLTGKYLTFEISGIADGAIGRCVSSYMEAPYLVVVEAKRGLEAQNPLFQLYGQLLAAARLNWQLNTQDPQEVFGCYTIADAWTFVRAIVQGLESDRPSLTVETSREYSEKNDAVLILKLLRSIVGKQAALWNEEDWN